MEEDIYIDQEAKFPVRLIKIPRDAVGNPYFIGKLQFPGPLEFEHGVSFMVFIADNGLEELQIAPLDPVRIKSIRNGTVTLNKGKLCIKLQAMEDRHGSTYYIGEAMGLSKIDLRPGIFFTIFTSLPGQEQIQISRLQAKPRIRHEDSQRRTNTFDPKRYSDHT
jgi:hypothetical protein